MGLSTVFTRIESIAREVCLVDMNNNLPSFITKKWRLLSERNIIYSSDGPQPQPQPQLQLQQKPKPRKNPLNYKACGRTDHFRKSSRKYSYYKPKSSNNNPPFITTNQQTNDNNIQSSNLVSISTTILLSPDEYATPSKKLSYSFDCITVLKDVIIKLRETAVSKSMLSSMSLNVIFFWMK